MRAAVVLCLTSLAACQEAGSPALARERTLTVLAAASLREAFEELGGEFERREEGTDVAIAFAGSQTLRLQIEHGARADVFASADSVQMDALGASVVRARPLARNEPVLVVSNEAVERVRSFSDLSRARRIVLGTHEVPIGRYADAVIESAGRELGPAFARSVQERVVSREPDTRQVLSKIVLGEADAGIVYRTDAATAEGKLQVVAIEPRWNVVAVYPIALVASGTEPELGEEFVELALSLDGQRLLGKHGFLPGAGEP